MPISLSSIAATQFAGILIFMSSQRPTKHVRTFDLTVSSDRSDYEDLLAGEDATYGDIHVLHEADFAFGATGAIMRVVDFTSKGEVPAPIYSAPVC
jgi:hypothetical protein